MKFSLLLASRERLELLTNLLDSLIFTTKDPQSIEILIGVDSDDKTYDVNLLEEKYSKINLKFFIRERSIWMHRDYINFLYKHSTGKYIIVLNDDTMFESLDWDANGFNCLEKYLSDKPDGIVYGFTENHSGSDMLCTFPLLSRNAIDVLGWVLPNERVNWAADHDVFAIYGHEKVNRKLYLPDILISHISIHTGKRERDEISYQIEKSWMPSHNIYFPKKQYIEKVSNYIKKFYSLDNSNEFKISCISHLNITSEKFKVFSRQNTSKIVGDLIIYLSEGEIFYENALQVFVNYFKNNPEAQAVCGSINLTQDGIYCGQIRNKLSYLFQVCHRRELGIFDLPFIENIEFIDIKIGSKELNA